jgi:twitching motility two-component system response regulator PilH
MVVEDEELFAYLLRRYAEKSGCQFVSAHLKEEALDLARREQPAVILVDIVLAGTSGEDVLRALKADPDTRAIPVVMCSGRDEDLAFWTEMGAHDCLQKPVRYERFLAMLASLTSVGVQPRE